MGLQILEAHYMDVNLGLICQLVSKETFGTDQSSTLFLGAYSSYLPCVRGGGQPPTQSR